MGTTPEMIEPDQSGSDAFLNRRQSPTRRLKLNPSSAAIVETETEIWRTGQDTHGFEADRGMGIAISAVCTGHPDDFWLEARDQEFAKFFLQFLFWMFHRLSHSSSFFAYLAHAARWLMILLMRAQTSRLGTRPLRSAKIKVGSSMTARPKVDGATSFSRRNVSISSRNSADVCIGNFLHLEASLVKQKKPRSFG